MSSTRSLFTSITHLPLVVETGTRRHRAGRLVQVGRALARIVLDSHELAGLLTHKQLRFDGEDPGELRATLQLHGGGIALRARA